MTTTIKIACALALAACASGKPAATPGSGGSGAGSAPVAVPSGPITTCEGATGKLQALYRADAEATMPGADKAAKRDELVADNVHMVMVDCAKDPTRVVPCLDKAKALADVEHGCLAPLDDEGTEGDAIKANNLKKAGR